MKIKIIGQNKEEPTLYVEGISGKSYPFRWAKEDGGYVYQPKSQAEADDIFQSQNMDGLFFFGPVLGSGDGDGSFVNPPTVTPGLYDDLSGEDLRELARDCDIPVKKNDEDATIRRLLDAFFTGQANPVSEAAPKKKTARKKTARKKAAKKPEPDSETVGGSAFTPPTEPESSQDPAEPDLPEQ